MNILNDLNFEWKQQLQRYYSPINDLILTIVIYPV